MVAAEKGRYQTQADDGLQSTEGNELNFVSTLVGLTLRAEKASLSSR